MPIEESIGELTILVSYANIGCVNILECILLLHLNFKHELLFMFIDIIWIYPNYFLMMNL
jgi:hypothetical protein